MENITKDFVPYNQSLELKELGFDEPCLTCYIDEEDKGELLSFSFDSDRCFQYIIDNDLKRNSQFNKSITSPTFSQAFRWFRENYGVHMYPQKFDETKWWVNWGLWRSDIFDSFEEAELACLIKMIEILKIMKNNVKRK